MAGKRPEINSREPCLSDAHQRQAFASHRQGRRLATPDALLYTADGPEQVPNGSLPGLPAVINFGTGDAKQGFETLKKLQDARAHPDPNPYGQPTGNPTTEKPLKSDK